MLTINQGRRHLPLHCLYPPPGHDNLCPYHRRHCNPESHALQQIRHSSFERNIRDLWTLRAGCGACTVSPTLHSRQMTSCQEAVGFGQIARQVDLKC